MGGRRLRRWMLFPSVDLATIRRRHDAVERLVAAHGARDRARKILGEIGDIERLVGRARLGVATPSRPGGAGAFVGGAAGLGRRARGDANGGAARGGDGRAGSAPARCGRRRWDPHRRARRPHRCRDCPPAPVRRPRHHEGRRLRQCRGLARARRAARHRRWRPQPHRRHRGARAGAHRDPLAEGEAEQRLRLLHRGHPRQPRLRSRRLPAQADRRQRRTVRDARAGRVRAAGPLGRRAPRRARAGAFHRPAQGGRRGGRAAAGAGRAGRHRRRAGRSRRGGPPGRLLPPGGG